MAKLTNLKSRLVGGSLSRVPALAADRELAPRSRALSEPWRVWYKTQRWRELRLNILKRDNWTCRATGVKLVGKYPAPNSPVIDHITPHHGDPALFWDEDNLQAVSRAYHDGDKKSEERREFGTYAHPKGLAPSAAQLTVVCGPPCGGKSTFVDANARRGDIVIDVDEIASRLAGSPMHRWPKQYLVPALAQRNRMLRALSQMDAERCAWFIVSEANGDRRLWWWKALAPARMVLIAPPEDECIRRAEADASREVIETKDAITKWWEEYTFCVYDERLPSG